MGLYGIVGYGMVLHGIVWCRMFCNVHGIAWYLHMVLYCMFRFTMVPQGGVTIYIYIYIYIHQRDKSSSEILIVRTLTC